MNGAESLVRTLVASGVEVCFTNPGTSEMNFVAALDKVAELRPILGLFEGVVTGAADGYGRMAGKPAATLLHLGPGLGNGLANLHNARRAQTPIVNIVGDHATYHAQYDAPLASDVMGIARPVSGWVHSATSAKTVASDGARAVQAARQAPGQIATLILPADTAWLEAARPAPPLPVTGPARVDTAAIDQVVDALRGGKKTTLLIGGAALRRRGLETAGRIAAKTGARLTCDTFTARLERGAGLVALERIPYFAEQIVEFMKDTALLVLVGTKPPVSFFAYPGRPSWCTPEGCRILYLTQPHEDGVAALEAVAEALGAPREPAGRAQLNKPELSTGYI
ncbi:MAG TPA: acetolactate synthase large subunit, partial [Stellaceae bacterium]|nr:acetolactate synthase large subunit [Stellaceae bacterium]